MLVALATFLLSPTSTAQITGLPDVFPVSGTSTFGTAYASCLAGPTVYSTCEILDYNLTNHPETMNISPWNFNGLEVPVHLRFGPGVLLIYGPLIVPETRFSRALVELPAATPPGQ